MAKHSLKIVKDANGDLQIEQSTDTVPRGSIALGDPIHVKKADKVHWTTDIGHLAILFKDESPFGPSYQGFAAKKGKTTSGPTVTGGAGEYEYAITIIENGVVIPPVDPILEVDDTSGGS